MLVLTWNLFHGRSLPPSRGGLYEQFTAKLAAWEWDVALLQEVPPWWPAALARELDVAQRTVLTSRNALLALRRAVAARRPELLKSNGGGANAVLARMPVVEQHALRLRTWPERRVAQLVRLAGGTCVANYHASARVPLAADELARLAAAALDFAGARPLVLGGDLNLRSPLPPHDGFAHVAERDVDHLLVRGLAREGRPELLARDARTGARTVELSDHPPLRVRLRAGG